MTEIVIDDRGVVVPCPTCGQKNRLLYERLSGSSRCGKCKGELGAPAEPVEIKSALEFDFVISKASIPVVVDYSAPWCGPCRMVAPELQKVAMRQAGRILVVKVNTEALPELGRRFGVQSIPMLAVFAQGREVSRSVGARPAEEIEVFIDQATHAHR